MKKICKKKNYVDKKGVKKGVKKYVKRKTICIKKVRKKV